MDTSQGGAGAGIGLTDAEAHLVADFAPDVPPETIHRIVLETAADFRDARAPAYVPILVERLARERLAGLARAHGGPGASAPAQRGALRPPPRP